MNKIVFKLFQIILSNRLKLILSKNQSSFIRKLLWKSIAREKLEFVLKEYLNDKISIGKASEIADISIWEMLDELKKRNITLNYKIEEAELEIERILQKYNKK